MNAFPITNRRSLPLASIARCRNFRIFAATVALLGAIAATAAPVNASTINVPGDKATISAAVAAAANGDTILVADGTYSAAGDLSLFINKTLTIKSVNGAASTTINCSSNWFAILNANCTIQGFTFQNANSIDIGVLLMATDCTVSECAFKNNTNFGGNGAAMQLNGGTTTITNCTFDHQNGSGAIGSSGGSATITNCSFTNGNAESGGGGGAINLNTGTVTISNCTFDSNTAGSQPGGVFYWRNGALTVTDSTFTNNNASYGGVILEGAQGIDSPATFTRCLFRTNSATALGGVAALEAGSSHKTSFIAKNCLFIGNSAATDGAVVDGNTAGSSANAVNITNCSFYANSSPGPGTGAICGGATTSTTILNSILYGDLPKEISTTNLSNSLTVTFTDIHQSGFAGGTGNINSNPQYLDLVNGDLHILSASPAARAGTSSGAPPLDYDKVTRPSPPSMGAFEPTIIATHFVVSAPTSATAGTAFNTTVTAEDDAGHIATGYAGTVNFTTSSSSYNLPADTTLVNGTGTFATKLNTTGSQTVSATDTVDFGITGTSGAIDVAAGAAGFLTAIAPATVTAGTPFNITVNAFDAFGNPATDYTGPVSFNSGDPSATLPPDSSLSGGTGTFSVTLATPGSQTIDVHDVATPGITGNTSPITVNAAPATHYSIMLPANAVAGTPFNVTVTVLDSTESVAQQYSGTVHFTADDPNAVLPADTTLTNGSGTFSVTLKAAKLTTIRGRDTLDPSLTGTGSITVGDAGFNHLALAVPASVSAGYAFLATVSARDQYNNLVKSYTSTVHFTSTDPQAVLPADLALANGTAQVSVKLIMPGSKTITATEVGNPSHTATSSTITVTVTIAKLIITGPASTTAAFSNTYTVTAKDTVGNTATGYNGTVHFTTTDPAAGVSANVTLVNGVGTFHVTFKTAGSQKVTGTDTVMSNVTGSAVTLVNPGAATTFIVTAPTTAVSGTTFYARVTAKDKYSNTVTNYSGTVHFTSTDPLAVLPADIPLQSGTKQVVVKLKTHGNQTITVTDTVTLTIKGTSPTIAVN